MASFKNQSGTRVNQNDRDLNSLWQILKLNLTKYEIDGKDMNAFSVNTFFQLFFFLHSKWD